VTSAGALGGVRVVDLTSGIAGPVAGMLLADLGADVVKVYPPGGGPSPDRPGLTMWDRGKQSAELNPARPTDLAALDRLLTAADIVLVGTAGPGAAQTYDELLRRGLTAGQPAFWIVMPPYLLGETPWAGGAESAGLLFAWLGHAWSQASYQDVPVDSVFPLALHMQGIWAAITAVALLAGRDRGRRLAPLAVAGGAHGAQLVSPGGFATGRAEPHVQRPGGPGGALPNYRCYRCGDGQWLFFGAFTNAFIERGLRAIGVDWILADPRVGADPGKFRLPGNLGWITAELDLAFSGRPRAEWLALLEAADVPAAVAGESADWLDHEQVRAIGLRAELRNDAGEDIVMPGALIGMSQTPVTVREPARTRYPPLADLALDWPARPATMPPAPGPAEPELPLTGLRVLNLGTIIAGPYAATMLGELGAEVIKVERPPRGDEFRVAHGGRGGAGFTVYNRDQRSLLLDLTGEPGRDVFRRLTRSADVVVDNYRVGVLHRLGIDHDQLAALNPLVTSVSISAFGEAGELSTRPGFDPVVQAMSGIMRTQGGPDQADSPVFLTAPINDVLAAALGALGACAALYARDRIGRGQRVTVTLCASSCLLQSGHIVRFPGAPPLPAGGRDFRGPGPLNRLYQASDGWVRLAGGPAAAAEQGEAAIVGAAGELTVAQILQRAAAAGIPAVRARQSQELTGDEQLIRHGLLAVAERDDTGAAAVVTQVAPGRWLEMPGLAAGPPGPAPAPGEHGAAILAEIGLAKPASAAAQS
jgi:crotonobetainyl-CoA:carnitine CoA-transferase CaiB-like acyl-CoA transferase